MFSVTLIFYSHKKHWNSKKNEFFLLKLHSLLFFTIYVQFSVYIYITSDLIYNRYKKIHCMLLVAADLAANITWLLEKCLRGRCWCKINLHKLMVYSLFVGEVTFPSNILNKHFFGVFPLQNLSPGTRDFPGSNILPPGISTAGTKTKSFYLG